MKMYIYLALVLAFIGGIAGYGEVRYSAGYDARVVEANEALDKYKTKMKARIIELEESNLDHRRKVRSYAAKLNTIPDTTNCLDVAAPAAYTDSVLQSIRAIGSTSFPDKESRTSRSYDTNDPPNLRPKSDRRAWSPGGVQFTT